MAELDDSIHSIVAVTRCRKFCGKSTRLDSLVNYIGACERGEETDPGVSFHFSGGAFFIKIVENFRPEDNDNLGCGVLIKYSLKGSHTCSNLLDDSLCPTDAVHGKNTEKMSKQQCVRLINDVTSQVFGFIIDAQMQTWTEIGFDSFSVIEFSNALQVTFPSVILLPTTFYDFPTLYALMNNVASPFRDFLEDDGIERPLPNRKEKLTSLIDEPLAVIGMWCRFPDGCNNPADFWHALVSKRNCITEIPLSRWDVDELYNGDGNKSYPKRGGFLTHADMFDPTFFGISIQEAKHMDPQQRLTLEVCVDALNSAGYSVNSLRASNVGVFVGQSNNGWGDLGGTKGDMSVYDGTGSSASITANRLSFTLDFKGPSMSIDTACSSSLSALHMAKSVLLRGECDMALVVGVDIMHDSRALELRSIAGMLSPDGTCHTFGADANGYVRGEGCGAVVLKRLSDAEASADPILALIRGSAVNQDGHSTSLTAPNGPSQEEVIRSALRDAGFDGNEVDYVETHGTGTALGDPIEVGALKAVLAERRDAALVLGAVKTNIGHLEGAAGIASIIKSVLVLHHRMAPPNLHLKKLNPIFNLDDF